MIELYPLKFSSIYKQKIWGGQKLKTVLGKDTGSLTNCGESWEISGVEGNVSVVADGPLKGRELTSLIREYKNDLVGKAVYDRFGDDFPLLIKFIDADDDLSIQVHPDDVIAERLHNSFGKTEMWYILQSDPGATLISGFNRPIDRTTYSEYIDSGKLMEILNREKVEKDDVFFLPAGRVHTIGKGLLLAEIQQTSDITYRIYDFDRVDKNGRKRELHQDQALEALDFTFHESYKTAYTGKMNQVNPVIQCPYFNTDVLIFNKSTHIDHSNLDSFFIYICIEGKMTIEYPGGEVPLKKGETLLFPACIKDYYLVPDPEFKILSTHLQDNELKN